MKNDWVLQVQSDLDDCGIDLNEDEISLMKRDSFKKLVCEKIYLLSAKYLTGLKERHSKSEHLKYSQEMQLYLRNEALNIEGKRLLFKLRNRIIDVKTNFKQKYNNNLECRLCSAPEESQSHLVQCSEIISDNEVKDALEGYQYTDIFSTNLKIQEHLVNTWKKIIKIRNLKLKRI